jgi:hypothetical protein
LVKGGLYREYIDTAETEKTREFNLEINLNITD